jgi:hypothetical protein
MLADRELPRPVVPRKVILLADLMWDKHTYWWDAGKVRLEDGYEVVVYHLKESPVRYPSGEWDYDPPQTGPYQVWLNRYRASLFGKTHLDALTAQCILNELISYPERYRDERVDR